MTKPLDDYTLAINTHLEAAWPGTGNAANYWDATTGKAAAIGVLPTPPDLSLYSAIVAVLGTRAPDAIAGFDQSNAERYDLWGDMIDRLTKERDYLNTAIAAMTTFRGTLPQS